MSELRAACKVAMRTPPSVALQPVGRGFGPPPRIPSGACVEEPVTHVRGRVCEEGANVERRC